MNFKAIEGKNHKVFVKCDNIKTSKDLEILDIIKKTVSRKEYMPFINSFNKYVEYSYLYNEVWFPIQFWQDVEDQLYKLYGIHYILENKEKLTENQEVTKDKFQAFVNNLKLPEDISISDSKYKYQQECAYLALRNYIGRIEVATSGGKTFITYLYCRYICENIRLKESDAYQTENQKILIIVPSKLLAKQLKSDFEHYQKLEEKKIIVESIFSGSKRIIGADVICGTYQSLSNYDKDYFDDFRFIICDEVHRAKAYSIRENIYNKITNGEYFFGMSGTYPKKSKLDYIHIVGMYGPLLYQKSVKELMDDGISTPTKIHIIKINYIRDKNYSKDLREQFIEGIDKYNTEKTYFQTNQKRTEILAKLLAAKPENSLILVDTLDYSWMIADYLKQYFDEKEIQREIEVINYKVSGREKIIEKMKSRDIGFILIGTYGTMSTGVSIKNINQMYFVDGGKSEIRIRQSIGRGIRLHPSKKYCDVFDFWDNMPGASFNAHAKERMKIYREQKLDYKITEVSI